MYYIYYLKENEWEFFGKCYKEEDLDDMVELLTYIRPNKYIQIMKDDVVLTCLNGTEEQLFYFKNRYILHKEPEFDYVKEYKKTRK